MWLKQRRTSVRRLVPGGGHGARCASCLPKMSKPRWRGHAFRGVLGSDFQGWWERWGTAQLIMEPRPPIIWPSGSQGSVVPGSHTDRHGRCPVAHAETGHRILPSRDGPRARKHQIAEKETLSCLRPQNGWEAGAWWSQRTEVSPPAPGIRAKVSGARNERTPPRMAQDPPVGPCQCPAALACRLLFERRGRRGAVFRLGHCV